LGRRAVTLLVLDNAEHLLGPDAALAGLLTRWLDAVPALGQHTDAILTELGVDAAGIAALRAAEAI